MCVRVISFEVVHQGALQASLQSVHSVSNIFFSKFEHGILITNEPIGQHNLQRSPYQVYGFFFAPRPNLLPD